MTHLVAVVKPTRLEKKRGAEVIFVREDRLGYTYRILACKCYESWEQWGAVSTDVLSDNVSTVEAWRHGRLGEISADPSLTSPNA